MRIRRLELAGIGPFAAAYTIDFDALTAGGLFLLDGPTGSGKSTIIDAITWGLYGAVAGGRDSTDDRMRSTHAAPAAQSYVDLVFSVEAGTFRVRRTPSGRSRATRIRPTPPENCGGCRRVRSSRADWRRARSWRPRRRGRASKSRG